MRATLHTALHTTLIAKIIAIIAIITTTTTITTIANAQQQEYPPTLGDMAGFILYKERPPLPKHKPLPTKTGELYSLHDFKNNIVIANFWAPWCAPCIREIPSLAKLQQKYKNKNLKVILIDVNQTGPNQGQNFLNQNSQTKNLINLHEGGQELTQKIKLRALPTTFIIDKKSKIIGYLPGEAKWHGKSTEFLINYILNE